MYTENPMLRKTRQTEKHFTLFVWKMRGWARTKLLILSIYNQISIKTFLGVYAGYINIIIRLGKLPKSLENTKSRPAPTLSGKGAGVFADGLKQAVESGLGNVSYLN